MILYIIKDGAGNVYGLDGEFDNSVINATLYDEPIEAERDANEYGGHVVELVEKSEPVVVSEQEEDILKRAATDRYPASFIVGAVASNDALYADKESEDRLIRAYVNGWTVEKSKRWYVKVPHANGYWFYLRENHKPAPVSVRAYAREFTLAEIKQYGLQDCEKSEFTAEE